MLLQKTSCKNSVEHTLHERFGSSSLECKNGIEIINVRREGNLKIRQLKVSVFTDSTNTSN